MIHFEWIDLFLSSKYLHIVNMLLVCVILLVLTVLARQALKKSKDPYSALASLICKGFF